MNTVPWPLLFAIVLFLFFFVFFLFFSTIKANKGQEFLLSVNVF